MRHRRRQPDAAAPRRQHCQPRDAQRQLIAAFGAGQSMHFVHHHGAKAGEHRGCIRQRQQHRQALRRGQQQVRWVGTLARTAIGRRVAGARFDRNRQAHFLDRPHQVARDVCGERLQRADIQRMEALFSAIGARRCGQFDKAGQEPRQRLATPGRGDQQHALARACGIQHGQLVPAWGPTPGGEPVGKEFRQCSFHCALLLAPAAAGKAPVMGAGWLTVGAFTGR